VGKTGVYWFYRALNWCLGVFPDPPAPAGAEGFPAEEEEEEEDGGEGSSTPDEPDTAELRRRRLQKLASH